MAILVDLVELPPRLEAAAVSVASSFSGWTGVFLPLALPSVEGEEAVAQPEVVVAVFAWSCRAPR